MCLICLAVLGLVLSTRAYVFTNVDHDMAGLVLERGYPLEIHEVETEDHYLLTVFRIPSGRNGTRGGHPVILQHGILCSSAVWVLGEPHKSLGFILADLGYDVWLTNSRGNTYCKKHKYLDPNKHSDQAKFYNYSFHELGYYDLPATIDFILSMTGEKDLYYIGHSQGTTAFLAMGATRPEYNLKVRHMSALAPIAFLDHTRGTVRLLSHFASCLEKVAWILDINDLFDNSFILSLLERTTCRNKAITQPICDNVLFLIGGYDSQELNTTLVPKMVEFTPAGTSMKQLTHFAQLIKSGKYQMFDYGKENMNHYKQSTPPDYDLSKVATPVALHYSLNDWLSGAQDVDRLDQHLPDSIKKLVNYKNFNHLDFMWAVDAWQMVYKDMIEIMRQF